MRTTGAEVVFEATTKNHYTDYLENLMFCPPALRRWRLEGSRLKESVVGAMSPL
jgi:hypothetical protein